MSKTQSQQFQQPWAQLYNLEIQLRQRPIPSSKKVGRPRSPFPRTAKYMHLTADEKRLLASLTGQVQEQFGSDKVNGSQITGFALRLMDHIIKQKGGLGDIKEFTGLWERLTQNSSE
jgi:hypothetical protein